MIYSSSSLGIIFRSELGIGVGDTDSQLLGPLNDLSAHPGGNRMTNSGGISAVVHEKHLELRNVVHDNRLEAVGVDVACSLV